jgi:hypothetical protein
MSSLLTTFPDKFVKVRPLRQKNKKRKVAGVRVQVSVEKFQITKHKYQTNPNNRNSKFKTGA